MDAVEKPNFILLMINENKKGWSYQDGKKLGSIACPEHGVTPIVGIFGPLNRLGVGCVKCYGHLPLVPVKVAAAAFKRSGETKEIIEQPMRYWYNRGKKEAHVPEIVICAAIVTANGTIIRGHRHNDAIAAAQTRHLGMGPQQGFITSRNRYVDRKQGLKIQLAAGIASADPGGYRGGELYSEDLY